MARIEGGCLCGAVRYSCDSEPVMTAICHCAHCQKQSGTAFSVVIAVPRDSLSVRGDALKIYEDIGESGQPVYRKFCGKCGSPVVSVVVAMPEVLFIKSGTLDDRSWLQPESHIWVEHKQPWYPVPEGMPQIDRNPPLS